METTRKLIVGYCVARKRPPPPPPRPATFYATDKRRPQSAGAYENLQPHHNHQHIKPPARTTNVIKNKCKMFLSAFISFYFTSSGPLK